MITFYDSITGGRTLLDMPPPDISYHALESLQGMDLVEACVMMVAGTAKQTYKH